MVTHCYVSCLLACYSPICGTAQRLWRRKTSSLLWSFKQWAIQSHNSPSFPVAEAIMTSFRLSAFLYSCSNDLLGTGLEGECTAFEHVLWGMGAEHPTLEVSTLCTAAQTHTLIEPYQQPLKEPQLRVSNLLLIAKIKRWWNSSWFFWMKYEYEELDKCYTFLFLPTQVQDQLWSLLVVVWCFNRNCCFCIYFVSCSE